MEIYQKKVKVKMVSMSQKDLENILKRLEQLEQEVKELKNKDIGGDVQNKPVRSRLLKTVDSKYERRINRPYDED